MSTCPSCNKEYNCDFSFCPACGSALKGKRFCSCGNELNADDCFCCKCGARADSTVKASPRVSIRNAIISFVFANIIPAFSIYSIMPFFCFLFFPGVILFYCLSKKYANMYENEANKTHGFTIASRIISLVCLILGICFFFIGIILTISIFM